MRKMADVIELPEFNLVGDDLSHLLASFPVMGRVRKPGILFASHTIVVKVEKESACLIDAHVYFFGHVYLLRPKGIV
jgi:hypothetical protein